MPKKPEGTDVPAMSFAKPQDQALADFLERDAELLERAKLTDRKKQTEREKYRLFVYSTVLRLSTLADIIEAKMKDIVPKDIILGKFETRLTKGERMVVIRLQKDQSYYVTYFKGDEQIGGSETHLGLRRLAAWLLEETGNP